MQDFILEEIMPDANNIDLADNNHEGTNPDIEQPRNDFWDHITLETEEPMMAPIEHNPDVQKMERLDQEEKVLIQTQTHFLVPETPFLEYENNKAISYPNNEAAFYPNSGADSYPNNAENHHETQPSKRRKRKSTVWEHFTIEIVSDDCRRAYCNQCKRSYAYSKGSKVSGTSHLRRHVEKGSCAALLRSQYNNQSEPSSSKVATNSLKRRYKRASSTPQFVFDQNHCRNDIARMTIMHEYPLHMVEHPGFVSFVKNLQPEFNSNIMTFNTVQGDCIATYQMEKQSLRKFIQGIAGHVCLSLDVWTSSPGLGYVFVTGHFIDADWKLHRRLLNVVMEPYPDSDTALSHALKLCLHNWSLENKLFSVTYNDRSFMMSESVFESLKLHLPSGGQLLSGNCLARTLSSIAKEVLVNSHDTVKKIRESIKYVTTSEPLEEEFIELKKQLHVPSERNIFLDDQAQWNTTYQMLVAANELKQVFSCLDTYDAEFDIQAPSMEDWKQVETLCVQLKSIFDTAYILATTKNPTANLFFPKIWRIHGDLSAGINNEDPFVSYLSRTMLEKINTYWKHCSLTLAVAVVMDPRYKMRYVEFTFTTFYSEEEAATCIKMVDDRIHELFQEYSTMSLPLAPNYAEEFDVYIMENLKTELDQYLAELPIRVHDFDVLGWWKLNQMMYPTLSQMARDILSFPVSTVPCDSVFDTNAKEMDQYRSSLQAETVEALVCAKDWMQYGSSL
ncbi:zinc finger BED domain-containing protein DAYSLEEPER-like [Argentina anserina]|uniref:zinc finger BED domain-containing protein DAYSLEEPER-like n=1 Tax=Argentina anserina TaxID=57926 RepID=UPI002176945F|nr:zinc finger BED domain-containing protein DAYSLEEPER-like [Potentilla anserina]